MCHVGFCGFHEDDSEYAQVTRDGLEHSDTL